MLLVLTSCEKDFKDPGESHTENVCGFEVSWRSQITEEQMAAIREILFDMVRVEGGFFVMGATPEQAGLVRPNELPTSYVKLSDYYICRHEVTDEEFNIIMDRNINATATSASRISLSEWKQFIALLNDFTSLHFNFPTEAQWEFAARGGNKSQGFIYPGSNEWQDVCSGSHTAGSELPNELGIYNMGDLKSEWCRDFYEEYLTGSILLDWVQKNGKYQVVRGGNYLCTELTEKYQPKNNRNGYVSYLLGQEASLSHPEMDYRNCRTTSRSYDYGHEIGNTIVGLRLAMDM